MPLRIPTSQTITLSTEHFERILLSLHFCSLTCATGSHRSRLQCVSDIVIYATYTDSRFHRVKALSYLSSQEQCMMVLIRQLKSPYFSSKAEMKTGQEVSWTLQHLSAFPKPPRCVYLRAVCPFPHHFVPGTRNKSISSRFLLQGYDLSRLPCPALIASYWTAKSLL